MDQPDLPSDLDSQAEALASWFWRVHPREIQDMGISREQFYAREIKNLLRIALARKET